MLYLPRGFAHGFVNLRHETEIFYQMSSFFEPGAARGAHYDDPVFAIRWPLTQSPVVSDRDWAFPPFDPKAEG